MINEIIDNNKIFDDYYEKINQMIINSKTNIIRNINHEMVELYYNIGQAINELIDEYNLEKSQNEIIKSFSNKLTKQFGQGFSVPSLKKMKKFYQVFNGGSTLWNQLSWSHNRLIMNIEDEKRRNFYLDECIKSNWSVRQLERQINSFYYERLISTKEPYKEEVKNEINTLEKKDKIENFVKDSYVLETTYCTNCQNCKLFKRGICLRVGRLITGNCPYGKKVITTGSSPRSKSYYDLKHKYYSQEENLRSKLKSCDEYITQIDDTYVFLNIPYVEVIKTDVGEIRFYGPYPTLPGNYTKLTCKGFISNDGAVVEKKLLNESNISDLLEMRPHSFMGGEIKDYQKDIVPLLKEAIIHQLPEVADRLGLKQSSHVGMKAKLETLNPNITFTYDNKKYYWDGEYVIADGKNINWFNWKFEVVGKVKLKLKQSVDVIVEDESWCNKNTVFVR